MNTASQSETEFKKDDIVFYKQKPFHVMVTSPHSIAIKSSDEEIAMPKEWFNDIIKINVSDQVLVDKSFLKHPIWAYSIAWCSRNHTTPEWMDLFIDAIENQKPVNLDKIHYTSHRKNLEGSLNKVIQDNEFPLLRVYVPNKKYNLLVTLQYIRPYAQIEVEPTCVCPSYVLLWGHNKGCYLAK